MRLRDIRAALHKARRAVMSDDEAIAASAAEEIARLKSLHCGHPDEIARRGAVRSNKDEVLLFRYR